MLVNSEELLSVASMERGRRLSRRQLAEWHREGLLPLPETRGRGSGGGRGLQAVYPDEARERLLIILDATAANTRVSFPDLRWWLWMHQVRIPFTLLQNDMLQWIGRREKDAQRLYDALTSSDTDDETADARWERV